MIKRVSIQIKISRSRSDPDASQKLMRANMYTTDLRYQTIAKLKFILSDIDQPPRDQWPGQSHTHCHDRSDAKLNMRTRHVQKKKATASSSASAVSFMGAVRPARVDSSDRCRATSLW